MLEISVFRYYVGAHNVFKVNGSGYQNNIKPKVGEALGYQNYIKPKVGEALSTGNDTIVLATPGRKCITRKLTMCLRGMELGSKTALGHRQLKH
ncbi:hypothetical protein GH714_004772 [Hevea brasiliensis]|uniref:Uncharacterized protein n=1 Tax=Hevea brasiliensis TaxID=3981 RepID=A0A6A6KJT6_HEVBR|nr:hypothetical protein GH714_004772 [Hevea brasiliensis]